MPRIEREAWAEVVMRSELRWREEELGERNSLSLSSEKGSWLLCEVMRSTPGQVSTLIYTRAFSLSLDTTKYYILHLLCTLSQTDLGISGDIYSLFVHKTNG